MEKLKIGVYVCGLRYQHCRHCKRREVVKFARELPNVTIARGVQVPVLGSGQKISKKTSRPRA